MQIAFLPWLRLAASVQVAGVTLVQPLVACAQRRRIWRDGSEKDKRDDCGESTRDHGEPLWTTIDGSRGFAYCARGEA